MTREFISRNPANGEIIQSYSAHPPTEIESRLQAIHNAQKIWGQISVDERCVALKQLSKNLIQNKQALAKLISLEMGKIYNEAVAEIQKCAQLCRYYQENAPAFLEDELVASNFKKSYISYRPLGTILCIMPWNFPFWQVFRVAIPALLAGNAIALKHAPNVTGCALAIEKLFAESGLEKNLLQTLLAPVETIEEIIGHSTIAAVSLTGSTNAGRSVASVAGKYLKPTVLELGGNDPYIVLADTDLDRALESCLKGRFLNCGQSCVAAKRWIVHSEIANSFRNKAQEAMAKLRTADPFEEAVDLGPMAREDLRSKLHQQLTQSLKQGARLLMGGEIPQGPGYFYPPTLIDRIASSSPAYREELFGPVASIIEVDSLEQAIQVANDTPYGLGASIFTQDEDLAETVAREQLNAGNCFVNDFVKSDPRLPFGGIKNSGYGRELSFLGIKEFVNAKTLVIN